MYIKKSISTYVVKILWLRNVIYFSLFSTPIHLSNFFSELMAQILALHLLKPYV